MSNDHIDQLRQVMTVALQDYTWHPQIIDAILAATYPPACQTCDGSRWVERDGAHGDIITAPCPDCPTIADLLAWGVAVATAEIEMGLVEWGDQSWLYADRLLDAIRAVKP